MPNPEQVSSFVNWYQKHITGDEKGHAQIFLDRLFQGFGLSGSLDVGGTSFADYVWKPVVLIEMKKRGENLHWLNASCSEDCGRSRCSTLILIGW